MTVAPGNARRAPVLSSARGGLYPGWTIAALVVTAIVIAPYVPLLLSAVRGGGESWDHVRSTVLLRYTVNTVVLTGVTAGLATVIGVAGAWILERYDLRGKALLELLFIAPLSVPVYIGAFAWRGILGVSIPFRGIPATVFVMTAGFYPYVYLTTRAALAANSRVLFDVVASLSGPPERVGPVGLRRRYLRGVWNGILPTLRPAVVGGAGLVAMEVMNAYGTPVYLGIDTLSTGVFRTWFGLGDLDTASTLAAIVLLAMFGLVVLEQYGRGRRRFTAGDGAPPRPTRPGQPWRFAVAVAVTVPPLVGFVLPVAQLAWWSVLSAGHGLQIGRIAVTAARTVLLAGGATILLLAIAVVLTLAAYLRPGRLLSGGVRLAGIGYAVPGTVVAIGVLAVFQHLSGVSPRLFLFGTIGGLLFAYATRYLAVAIQPIQAAFARQHRSTVDAARSLGSGPFNVLFRVVLPVFRPTLAGAALLVAIDVIKDLPMTLLLRPFDFSTLAVEAFRLASDERMPEAAPRALLLTVVGLIAIWIIARPGSRNRQER